jgi:hypothetical protein
MDHNPNRSTMDQGARGGSSSSELGLVAALVRGTSPRWRGNREEEAAMLPGCRRGWWRGGDDQVMGYVMATKVAQWGRCSGLRQGKIEVEKGVACVDEEFGALI